MSLKTVGDRNRERVFHRPQILMLAAGQRLSIAGVRIVAIERVVARCFDQMSDSRRSQDCKPLDSASSTLKFPDIHSIYPSDTP